MSLYGLVLVGGKSTRMKKDKSSLVYGELDQKSRCYQLLTFFCQKTFLSYRPGQEVDSSLPALLDQDSNIGPAAGLLSAYSTFPEHSWLIIACDFPHLDSSTLQKLVESHHPKSPATVLCDPDTQQPQPLIGIWTPVALQALQDQVHAGQCSLQKTLRTLPVQTLFPDTSKVLFNSNTPDDYQTALKNLTCF